MTSKVHQVSFFIKLLKRLQCDWNGAKKATFFAQKNKLPKAALRLCPQNLTQHNFMYKLAQYATKYLFFEKKYY